MLHAPISMYVPARNAERTLAECIESIRTQTRPPDELFIIADTRSSDRTVELARSLNVTTIEQTGHTLGSARNQAIQHASHRWLASCDSDVFLEREWLANLTARRTSGAVGIGGRTLENPRTPFDEWRAIQMPHHWGEHPLRNPFMLVSEVLFDRQALLNVGGYRSDLNYYEDSDLCQRLRDAGYDLLYEPAAVAHHQRSDTLLSVLRLRWVYSEYRQRHLLDRYADLPRKLAANREYALNTLARLLARGRADLSYTSFLLFFHHAVMDLRSLHSRRPLLTPEQCAADEAALLQAATELLNRYSPCLADAVQHSLAGLFDQPTASVSHSASQTRIGHAIPVWPQFIQRMQTAIDSFCCGLPASVLTVIEDSSRHLCEGQPKTDVRTWNAPDAETLRQELADRPLQPFADDSLRRELLQQWPEVTSIRIQGPAEATERAALEMIAENSPEVATALAALHLECRPDPTAVFVEVPASCRCLLACYQPPQQFIPGLDIPSASDLASAAAAAGWSIDRFDTLIGRTRLMLSR